MKARDFLLQLSNFCAAAPGNGDAEVMLALQPSMCFPFGEAKHALGIGGDLLIFVPYPNAQGMEVRNVRLN